MQEALLINLPRAFARRVEEVLLGLGLGRIDARSIEEAIDLMQAIPPAVVVLHEANGPAEVVKALSLLPLTPSQHVVVFAEDDETLDNLEGIETERIGCFGSDLASKDLLAFLRQVKTNPSASKPAHRFGQMLGDCEAMREVYTLIAKVAPTEASVLICGESGTGKELVANAIHRRSDRGEKPFVAINCGAIAENLIESELFGHEKGAFTGAQKAHPGVFEQADGGTLFLDEVTEMPIEMQVRLLRVLESGTLRRLGGEADVEIDVRVIAATNRNTQEAIDSGQFREDLMFRLAVFPIALPPVRERGEDIQQIARYFLSVHNEENGTSKRLTKTAEARLRSYDWPGNVRQVRNIIHRAYIIEGESIDLDCLQDLLSGDEPSSCDAAVNSGDGETSCDEGCDTDSDSPASNSVGSDDANAGTQTVEVPVGTTIDEAEKQLILKTMQELEGDKPAVAKVLGISLKTLYNRLNSYEEQA